MTVRNQTRYNRTPARSGHQRDPERGGVQPGDQAGDDCPSGQRAREQHVLEPDLADRSVRHRARCAMPPRRAWRCTTRSSSRPTLTGLGTRAPVNIYAPNPQRSGRRLRAGAHAGVKPTARPTRSALYVFDTVEVSSRWQVSGGVPLRALRHRLPRTSTPPACTTADLAAADGVISGKAGVLFRVADQGNVYLSVRHVGDAAGHRQLHAERASQQPEQPERGAAGVDQLRGRQQVGRRRRPAVADRRRLPHREQERHLHGRRDGDSADLQPGRRPAREGRHAGRDSARSRTAGRSWPTSATSIPSSSSPERRNNGRAADADAEVLGQHLDHLPAAAEPHDRRRRPPHRRRVRQRGQHDQVARLHDRRRVWRSTP